MNAVPDEIWEHELARRAADLLAGQYVHAPRCYFEPNARKLRFPSGGDAADIAILVPPSRPDDLDLVARDVIDRYVSMLPHRFPIDERSA